MILAAGTAPRLSVDQLPLLVPGALLLLTYVVARLKGRDLLPQGPTPELPFRIFDVLAILIASFFLQLMLVSFAAEAGLDRTHRYLMSFTGPGAVALGVWWFALRRRRAHGTRWKAAVAGGLSWLAVYPVVAMVLVSWVALLEMLGQPWVDQPILTALQKDRVIFFTLAVVLAPLAEETLFRGLLYGTLRRRHGKVLAVIVSGALFALVHGHPHSFPALFVLGAALALLYDRTGTLAGPIALHATFNAWTFVGHM